MHTLAKFCYGQTHSQRECSIWRGISFLFLAPIQWPVVCLFPHSKQPNILYVSFQLEFLGQIWRRLVCFPFIVEAKSATECIIFIPFITMTKAELPLSSDHFLFLFFLHSVMTKALHPRARYCVCFYTRLHHQVARAANPWPAGDFPWCSAAAQCVTDIRVGDSSRFGLADAMHPGMLLKVWFSEADLAHTKKKSSWYLPHSL